MWEVQGIVSASGKWSLFELWPYGWRLNFLWFHWYESLSLLKSTKKEKVLFFQTIHVQHIAEWSSGYFVHLKHRMSQHSLWPTSFLEDPDVVSIGETHCDGNFVVIVLYPLLPGWKFLSKWLILGVPFHTIRPFIPFFSTIERQNENIFV